MNNQILKQNTEDIEKFYNFLRHKTKTDFQVFFAMTHIKTSTKQSIPGLIKNNKKRSKN